MIGKLAQDVGNRDAQTSDAGLAGHDSGIKGDAFQFHDWSLP
jgi:hypothetical protein